MTTLLIQVTIAIGIFIAGYGLGELVRMEVVDSVSGERRPRWPWLTTQRITGVLLVLLALSGIMTTYSVRSCQTEFNKNFANALQERQQSTDLVYDSLVELFDNVLDPALTPDQRADAVREARNKLQASRQVRLNNPLPPLPQC